MLRALLTMIFLTACGSGGGGGAAKAKPTGLDPRLTVAVDPRVELLCIVSRLAGYPEYGKPPSTAYGRDVDAHFAQWREHPAVVTARALRAERGIGFNAPMGLAVYLDAAFIPIRPLTSPLPELDERWNGADLEAYVAQLQDFAQVTGFTAFLAGHRAHHDAVEAEVRRALDGARVVDWYDAHFGARPDATFLVAPGLLTGDMAYSAQAVDDDGARESLQVVYLPPAGPSGIPTPPRDLLYLLVHEFAHGYVNPALAAHADVVVPAATPLHARHADVMARQHYPNATIMANESVVRALVVLYAMDRGPEGAAVAQMTYERQRGFLWIKPLADALAALRKASGGRLEPAAMAAAARDVFTAWMAEHP